MRGWLLGQLGREIVPRQLLGQLGLRMSFHAYLQRNKTNRVGIKHTVGHTYMGGEKVTGESWAKPKFWP